MKTLIQSMPQGMQLVIDSKVDNKVLIDQTFALSSYKIEFHLFFLTASFSL